MTPIPIHFLTDAHGQWRHVDDGWQELTGSLPATALGSGWQDFIHPHDWTEVVTAWQQALAQGPPFRASYRLIHTQGGFQSVQHTLVRTPDGWMGSLQPQFLISAPPVPTESWPPPDFLNQVLNATPNGLYIYDLLEQRYIYANGRLAELLGYNPSQWLTQGQPWLTTTIHPDDQPRVWQHRHQFWQHPETESVAIDYRFRHADGHWHWAQTREVLFSCTPSGIPHQVLGVVQDITDRKATELALKHSQQQFQTLVENSPDIIQRFDRDLKLVYASPSLAQFLRVEAHLLMGQTWREILHMGVVTVSDRFLSDFDVAAARLWQTGEKQRLELTLTNAQDTWQLEMLLAPERNAAQEIESILCLSRDITAYQEAVHSLRISEQRLTTLISNLPGFVYTFLDDPDYTALYVSDGIQAITGYTPSDFTERRVAFAHLMNPDDNQQVWQQIRTAILQQHAYEFEYRITTRAGQERWVWERGQGVFDDQNQVLYTEGFITDITDRKAAELALQRQIRQEQALNRIVSAIRDSLDLETIFTTATQEVATLLDLASCSVVRFDAALGLWIYVCSFGQPGYPSRSGLTIPDQDNPLAARLKHHEIVHHATSDIQDPVNQRLADQFPGVWLLVPLILEGRTWGSFSLFKGDLNWRWMDDQIHFVQAIATQLTIAIQQAELYSKLQRFNQSLTFQVQERTTELQQALAFESLLQDIIEQVRNSLDEDIILQTVVHSIGEKLSLIFCNVSTYGGEVPLVRQYFSRLEDYHYELVLPMQDYDRIYDLLKQGEPCYFSTLIPSLGKWVTIFLAPVCCDDLTLGDILVMRPRGELFSWPERRLIIQVANQCAIALRQSRLYGAAQAQVAELQRLNQLKDDFLSTVSHELRTPLSSIKMATHMLGIHLAPLNLSESIYHYLSILESEGSREIHLINDLLDLSRLEAGASPVQLRPLDLRSFLEMLVSPLSARLQAHGQTLTLHLDPQLPPVVTDVNLLERILLELLHNACKYTPFGGQIHIRVTVDQDYLIQLTNTGIEVAAVEWERVFDKFYRIPNGDPWKHGGTGLGLALVKKMVNALGGRIWMTSGQQATHFHLRLPRQHPRELEGGGT
ncbi:MAG: hypothetical protein OHK0012_17070 [Synechococcales cyanobacterium]